VRAGGCVCGAVRYQTPDAPTYTVVCHCTFCQRATGSAFAVWPTFASAEVKTTGALKTYEHRSDESGRWIRLHFCARCGTTVSSTFEVEQAAVSILGGTFDDTGWIQVDRQVWTRSKQHWVALPGGVPAFEKSSRS